MTRVEHAQNISHSSPSWVSYEAHPHGWATGCFLLVHRKTKARYIENFYCACPQLRWIQQISITTANLSNLNTLQWRHNGRDSVSNHQPRDCLLNSLFKRRSKKTSKLRVTGLCAGNSPVIDEFPTQMASNVENGFIWWRHHEPESIKHLSTRRFGREHQFYQVNSNKYFTPYIHDWAEYGIKLIYTKLWLEARKRLFTISCQNCEIIQKKCIPLSIQRITIVFTLNHQIETSNFVISLNIFEFNFIGWSRYSYRISIHIDITYYWC